MEKSEDQEKTKKEAKRLWAKLRNFFTGKNKYQVKQQIFTTVLAKFILSIRLINLFRKQEN